MREREREKAMNTTVLTVLEIQIQFYRKQMLQNQVDASKTCQITINCFQIELAILKAHIFFRIIET